jgi:hypothetical protein
LLGPLGARALASLFNRGRRWFLPANLGADTFFHELQRRNVSYVVLRWFENLPHIEVGHDLDILVADEHVERLDGLLTHWPVGQPCDVYSTTGLPGFTYRPRMLPRDVTVEMAVFPPHLAARMLQSYCLHNGIRVPNAKDHFFSLAYHAVYLKGAASGLTSELVSATKQISPSHHYASVLTGLAHVAGIHLPHVITMDALDEVLARYGWRPPLDILENLAIGNSWIARKFFASFDTPGLEPGLAVFFIRQRAVASGCRSEIVRLLGVAGFDILAVVDLSDFQRSAVANAVRGANWGQGSWPVSGGLPATLVVAFDVKPLPVGKKHQRKHPQLDNTRILAAKRIVRRIVNGRLRLDQRYNALHSTDNSAQAWRFIQWLMPERAQAWRQKTEQLQAEFATTEEVIADLSQNGRRAKVELIRYDGRLAVKKTFRSHALPYLEREAAFYERFASERSEVPPILKRKSNYFIIPFYRSDFPAHRTIFGLSVPVLIPLWAVRQLVDFLRYLNTKGYDPIDLNPQSNVLISRSEGLKVIDFEFIYQHEGESPLLHQCFCLAGTPDDFADPALSIIEYLKDPYPAKWQPHIGLTVPSLLKDPSWLQRIKRSVWYPSFLFKSILRKAISRASRAFPRISGTGGA